MLGRPYRHLLVASCALLAAHVIYLGVGMVFIGHGAEDPIYKFTGLARKTQLELTAWPFILIATAGLWRWAHTQIAPSDFRRRGLPVAMLFSLTFINFLASSTTVFVTELHAGFWPYIAGHLGVVLTIELAAVLAIVRFSPNVMVAGVLFAALGTANAFALFLLLYDAYLLRTPLTHLGVAVTVFAALMILFRVAIQDTTARSRIAAVLVLTAAAPVASAALSSGIRPAPPAIERYDAIRFASTPDIHIVAMESLVPPSLARSILELPDVPYEQVLERDGIDVFRNAFASYAPTGRSLNSVMSLSDPAFVPWDRWIYFQGQADSPLSRVFHNNGYRVSAGVEFGSFGISGSFVDDYHPRADASFLSSGLCRLARKQPFALFWICRSAAVFDPPKHAAPWPDIALSRIIDPEPSGAPRLTFHHVILTFHTQEGFDRSDPRALETFRADYLNNARLVADYLDELIDRIRSQGPNAVLFMFGDHGALVGHSMTFDEDPAFFIQDRYGIAAAILYNSTDCGRDQLRHYSPDGYITPERVIAGIVRCVAQNPEAVDQAVDFSSRYDFSPFAYE